MHRIALAIEAARKRTAYTLGGRQVPYERMRAALRRIAQEYASRRDWGRWQYCVDLAGDFFNGGEPRLGLPSWLVGDLRNTLDRASAAPRKVPKQKAPPRRTASSHQPAGPRQERESRRKRAGSAHTDHAVEPARRPDRQLASRDVTYPPLVAPPQELVAESGVQVWAALRDTTGSLETTGETTAWLGLAAEHRSHLHENRQAENVTSHVLSLLERLGATALDVILLDAYAQWARPQKVGEQATEHNRRRRAADLALGAWATDHGLPRMSTGEAQQPARSVAEGVARQILGVLSLMGEHDTARQLVAAVWPDIDHQAAETEEVDAVTRALSVFAREDLTYDFAEEGPDHQKVFRVTARTRAGKTASGTGQSKKAARLAASRALLTRYPQPVKAAAPGQNALPAGTSAAPPLPYTRANPGHRDAVSDLAAMFRLEHRADGLLAQALTHASWILENQAAVAASHQRNNHLLAHHGSFVIDHLSAHTRARTAFARDLRLDEDDTRFHTSSDEDTAQLGTVLALADGLLTSRGESGTGRASVSDAAQAVIAAAWRNRGPELLRRRPVVLDEWLTALEHQHDPVTVLTAVTATYGMTFDFEYQMSGQDHLQGYTATCLMRDVTGKLHRWTAQPDGRIGKSEAKKVTAQDVIDILAAPSSHDLLDALTSDRRALLTDLLRAQVGGLGATSERQRTRILARGDLGADLLATGDTGAFMAWAERVGTLLGRDEPSVPEPLRALYRQVVDDARRGPRSLLRRMGAEQGADGASVIRRHAADAVLRAVRTGPWKKSVRNVVQDWWRDHAPETGISIHDDMRSEAFEPLRMQLGALHEALKWCGEAAGAAGTSVDLELTVQDGTLHVWIGLHNIDVRATCDDFAQLLSRTMPYTDCLVADDHVLLRLHSSSPNPRALSPLAEAGLDAYLGEAGGEHEEGSQEAPA
uniref:putative dsRNA-binding protein n=1 Tax=Streptomyces sp. NRRL S-325 TaxID=1463899 RepID=UPI001F1694F2|nr:putative dsRNA-binding protein [Streptomyces sp. NRRL S-325]